MRVKLKDVYFGWYMVLAGSIIAMWGYGSWFYGMSALFVPLVAEYGWTRAQLSFAFSMRSIEGGLEGPLGGWLIDKYGERKITIVSTVIAALGLFLVLFVQDIFQFTIVWGFVVSLGFNLGLYDTVNSAIAKWFVKRRGFALSIITVGGGLGAPVVVPLMAWLIVNWGWRSALIFVATATLVICLPLAWFFLRDKPPEHYGLQPDGGAPVKQGIEKLTFAEYNFTTGEAMRTKSFWMLLVSFMLDGGILTMVTMHQMPYLQDMGIDPIAAAGILGLMATMSLPGRVVFAWIGDRWGDRLSIILGYVLKTMGLIVFIIARDIPMLILFVVLFGTGYGGVMPTKNSIRAAYFGRKSFATITGWTNFFSAISGVAYPIFAGWSYDVSGSYIFSFSVVTVLQAVAIVFMVFATRPNPPKGVNIASEAATT